MQLLGEDLQCGYKTVEHKRKSAEQGKVHAAASQRAHIGWMREHHGLLKRRVCHINQPPPISATAATTKSATDIATVEGVHWKGRGGLASEELLVMRSGGGGWGEG